MSLPFIYIEPLLGVSKPAIRESRVDLPQPLGPTMPTNSPSFTWKETSTKAGVSPRGCGSYS